MSNHAPMSWLLARLEWPSGLVRERACDGIARLLVDPANRRRAEEELLGWIAHQQLESRACNGLLALARARDLGGQQVLPEPPRVRASIQRPSILSQLILRHLSPSTESESVYANYHSGPAPIDLQGDAFFLAHAKYFLPPQHYRQAEQLERHTRRPFIRQWEYEWVRIVQALQLKASEEPLRWANAPYEGRYAAMDFRIGDVYRSALLRALAWMVDTRALSAADSELFVLPVCPIDVGLWRVQPQRPPAWVPTISASTSAVDTTPAQVWGAIERMLSAQRASSDAWLIGAAHGLCGNTEHPFIIDVRSVFQRCVGPRAPSAEALMRCVDKRGSALFGPPSVALEGTLDSEAAHSTADEIDDWHVLPACVRVRSWTIPRWQHWRVWWDMYFPSPCLSAAPLTIEATTDAVDLKEGDATIGRWVDWTDGVGELLLRNLPPRSGQVLYLKRDAVDAFSKQHGFVLCWVCRIMSFSRKHGTGDFDQSDSYQLFGETRLIRR